MQSIFCCGTLNYTMTNDVIPPPTNNLVTPLLTDLYQLTMAYSYWKNNKHNDDSVFELFFRKNPFKGSFTIFCGLDELISFIHHFKFTKEDMDYLKSTPQLGGCEKEFFDFLSNLDCSQVTVQALQQGSVAFPKEPLITVSGPLAICQLLETTLLNLVNFPSLVATNAARMVISAKGQDGTRKINNKVPKLVEFGLRRAQGPDGAFTASKYCIVGGFDGTANVQAGKVLGIPIYGTHAHAFVMSFSSLDEVVTNEMKTDKGDIVKLLPLVLKYRNELGGSYKLTNDSELAAFIAYATSFPDGFLALVDTYDTVNSGAKNFIMVSLALIECGHKPIGIRLDSGDLASLSLQCQKLFIDVGKMFKLPVFNDIDIVASDGINEEKMNDMNSKGHGITMFGIGTNLVTCQAQPALGCVFKLVELNGKPRIKLSNDIGKVLIPGRKKAFRLFDKLGCPQMDILIEANEEIPKAGVETTCFDPFSSVSVKFTPAQVEELLSTVWDKKNGAVKKVDDLMVAKAKVTEQIKSLHPDMFLHKDPMQYQIYVSLKLSKDLKNMIASGTKKN
jgi:nicotinate phosphoribosyltransferase